MTGATPPFVPLARHGEVVVSGTVSGTVSAPPSPSGRSLPSVSIPAGRLPGPHAGRTTSTTIGAMLDRLIRAFLVVGGVSAACAWTWPGAFSRGRSRGGARSLPHPERVPRRRRVVRRGARRGRVPGQPVPFRHIPDLVRPDGRQCRAPVRLPTWPLSPTADGPAIVVGEVHHPVRAIESPAPEWLTIPERGLYTGVAIVGAVGSGKTSACMHPFARQLFGWQATNPERRAAALVLEVKGDFATTSAGCSPSWTEAATTSS